MTATSKQLLLRPEYNLAEGDEKVIICEKRVQRFDTQPGSLLDVTAIHVVHALSHLPTIADPSHGTGLRAKVLPMARGAVAAGADGLMIEVPPDPDRALSDGAQSIALPDFDFLISQVNPIADAIGDRKSTRLNSSHVAIS